MGTGSSGTRVLTQATSRFTAASRDEALAKMRDELRYRLEFCACVGQPGPGFADRIDRDAMSSIHLLRNRSS